MGFVGNNLEGHSTLTIVGDLSFNQGSPHHLTLFRVRYLMDSF